MIGNTLAVRYEIIAKVQEGPLFTMYSARDRLSGRSVGIREIKEPFNHEENFIKALVSTIPQIQVSNPALEALSEVIEEDGQHYLLSEMPKGSLLTERIKRFAPFTVPVALSTAIGIVEGLDALHSAGISHGDVGSHNVIATHDGSAKLQLGGVWRAYSQSRSAGLAVLSVMAPYLAPEVCQGGQPGPSSDLYSLGIILFELLTGRVPYEGDTATATTMRHISSPVPSLRGLNASIPVAVEQVVQKLLAKDPANRFATSREVLIELRTIADQLRFGRSPVARKTESQTPVVEPAPVNEKKAKIAKVKDETQREARRVKEKRDRDVPTWLLAVAAVAFLALVGAIVGFVVFLAQKPREIKMPNIKGITVTEARQQVKGLKLNIREASKEPSDRMDIGRILTTRPSAGQMIREGGTINVVVSSGSFFVKVPDLKGMTADEAKSALTALNLELDGKPSRVTNWDNPPGAIIRQLPEPNQKVERFSRIRIWIAAPSDAPVDSLPGERETVGDRIAHNFPFVHKVAGVSWRVTVRIEFEDADGAKTVYTQDHDAGDEIKAPQIGYGDSAKFRIYYDDELKDEKVVKVEQKPNL